MMLLLRVLSGVPVPWRDLSQGALVGGVGFSLLKLSATTLLPRVTANPLFASIAIVVGLLFWLNLIARLTLISAAWAANDVDEVHAACRIGPRPTRPRVGTPRHGSWTAWACLGRAPPSWPDVADLRDAGSRPHDAGVRVRSRCRGDGGNGSAGPRNTVRGGRPYWAGTERQG